jgi:hypothetical protein
VLRGVRALDHRQATLHLGVCQNAETSGIEQRLGAVPAGLDEEHAVLTDAPTRERKEPQTDRLGQARAVSIETQFDGGRHLVDVLSARPNVKVKSHTTNVN